VVIERVRGLGYRLAQECTWLDADAIADALGTQRQCFSLEVVPATGSTNSDLLARASAGATSGHMIVAEWQAGGRGRRGRGWVNPLGGALTFSLLWRFERGVAALSGLSLVVGLACARALRAAGARDVGVKWPNDLQVDGRKVGGILIELQGDALGPSAAVIGIGLNVRLPAHAAAWVDQPVADIHGAGGTTDRNRLLAILLQELAAALAEFTASGFEPFAEAFRALHVLQDRTVDVALGDGSVVTGVVEGVDAIGALQVATTGGLRVFHGGEVSVRRAVGG
jgi:BirA family biotin operon repressor/biotin-[acetyl-CoA-carboxylase] ligase